MKSTDKYRFTLQWGADSDEKVRAGDFLETLGNRKSEFIVVAVTEYLTAHPEALNTGRKLQIVVKPSFTQEQMRALIQTIIEERLAGITSASQELSTPHIETDIEEMLKNLDIFLG